ncbi:MAG: polyisoprenoid-binding protein [Betaproteobacteria bacterium HGW-Betaproteobacteria-13]|jgi:polyisoprenoid-binding protein YceI|uniref:Polyisoprenoid-binding protein n=1 Tax=Parazoarcus communis TaxID=41977 RepID=A0A2U8H2C7_9RHOO|nr:YceI family protein [Parazoarcus communis]AWI80071.1 polyisoprenoid-binding protein [Parazoarcus communis]PKO82044.1 MAG: polyisoprenoid-binding protein [Betaproteobacteria bacterium HGW-Betaproteobacteria-13]
MKTGTLRNFATAAALSLATITAASAAEFTAIDKAASRFTFQYTQMGVGMDGKFDRFAANIRFDPAHPEAGRAAFDIEVASIDTGSTEGNEEVKTRTWFNTAAHPLARFESTAFKALGDKRYEVAGKLTIKGQTRNVTAPFTFEAQGTAATVKGSLKLKRNDFAIGEGEWADTTIVANEIQINFQLRALQAAP